MQLSFRSLVYYVVQAHDIYKQLHNMNLSDLPAETIGKVLNVSYQS